MEAPEKIVPTYSGREIREMLDLLNFDEVLLLSELCRGEHELYGEDFKWIADMIIKRMQALNREKYGL